MVKLYLIALAAVILVFTPSDVSAVNNFRYTCSSSGVTVTFTPSSGHSGTVAVYGNNSPGCVRSFGIDEKFSYTFNFGKCAYGGRALSLNINEVKVVVHGGSSSSSSSSSSQSISC